MLAGLAKLVDPLDGLGCSGYLAGKDAAWLPVELATMEAR